MTTARPRLEWPTARRLVVFLLVCAGTVAFLGLAYYALLLSVVTSVVLTYLLHPLVDALERRRIPRTLAVVTIIISALGVIAIGLVRFVPVLYRQALSLVQLIPAAINAVVDHWLPVAEKFVAGFGVMTAEEIHSYIAGTSILSRLESQLQAGISGLWRTGTSVAGGMLNLILVPLLTLFLLRHYKAIVRELARLVPRDLVEPVDELVHHVSRTLRTVLKGQAIVAAILGILYVVGLSIVGLKSAIAIGVVAGICRIIPYLDVVVGGILSAIVLLSDFHGWSEVLMVTAVFVAVQAIDGAFVTPAILGERIGLHPMVVVLSVIAFGDWFGFLGVLIAVPIVAIIKVLLEMVLPYYVTSRTYLASGTANPAETATISPTLDEGPTGSR